MIDTPTAQDVLASLCSALRAQGAEADWNGEVIMARFPGKSWVRFQLEIDGSRVFTERSTVVITGDET